MKVSLIRQSPHMAAIFAVSMLEFAFAQYDVKEQSDQDDKTWHTTLIVIPIVMASLFIVLMIFAACYRRRRACMTQNAVIQYGNMELQHPPHITHGISPNHFHHAHHHHHHQPVPGAPYAVGTVPAAAFPPTFMDTQMNNPMLAGQPNFSHLPVSNKV